MFPQSKLHPLVKVLSGVVATAQEDGETGLHMLGKVSAPKHISP